jgi:hypothetical protein
MTRFPGGFSGGIAAFDATAFLHMLTSANHPVVSGRQHPHRYHGFVLLIGEPAAG